MTSFEKDQQGQKKRLATTVSGTCLQSTTPFRGRCNSAPQSAKKVKRPGEMLSAKHCTAELSPNIVRFHQDSVIAVSALNKKIKRGAATF